MSKQDSLNKRRFFGRASGETTAAGGPTETETAKVSRRTFVKSAATIAAVAAAVPLQPMLGGKESVAEAANGNSGAANRTNDCFNYRKNMAQAQKINIG